ncbi:glycosyltransferase family 87 protein (plasmid) [Roseobacteraceae bacterium NS-SX3]
MKAFSSKPVLICTGVFACAAIAALSLHGILRRQGLHFDFANYYDTGRKVLLGQYGDLYNEFALIGGQPPFGNMTFAAAPLSAFLYTPLALFPPYVSAVLFKLAGTLCLYAGLILLYRHLARTLVAADQRPLFFAMFAVAAMIYMPFWTVYWVGGQTTPVLFLLMVLALRGRARGRSLGPAIALVAAAFMKPVLAPGGLFLLAVSDTRFRLALAAAIAVFTALSFAIFGTGPHLQLADMVLSKASPLQQPEYNSNMFAWIEPLFSRASDYTEGRPVPGGIMILNLVLKTAAAAALAALYALLVKSSPSQELHRQFAIMLGAFIALILAPVVWAHYLAFLFPLLAVALATARQYPPRVLALAWAAIATAFFQHLFIVRRIMTLEIHGNDSWEGMMLISAVKSTPMILTFMFAAAAAESFAAIGQKAGLPPSRPLRASRSP